MHSSGLLISCVCVFVCVYVWISVSDPNTTRVGGRTPTRHFYGRPFEIFSVSLKDVVQSCSPFITTAVCVSLCYAVFTSRPQCSFRVIFQNDFSADGMKLSSNYSPLVCGEFVILFVNMYKGLLPSENVCVLWFIVPVRIKSRG